MMNPSQIKNYPLVQVKQGLYKMSDVESFRQKAYNTVIELTSANVELKEKFNSLSDLVNEYNAGKNSIANAIISAQAYANGKISEADSSAKSIISKATAEADGYYAQKKAQADKLIADAEATYNKIMAEIAAKADEYVAETNEKASGIINNANAQAAKIVSHAYADAQLAKDTTDEILSNANKALPKIKHNVVKFKSDVSSVLESLQNILNNITVPDDIEFNFTELDLDEFSKQTQIQEKSPFSYQLNLNEPSIENDSPQLQEEQSDSQTQIINEEPVKQTEINVSDSVDENISNVFDFDDISEIEDNIIIDHSHLAEESVTDDAAEIEAKKKPTGSDYIFDRFSAFTDLFSSSERSIIENNTAADKISADNLNNSFDSEE